MAPRLDDDALRTSPEAYPVGLLTMLATARPQPSRLALPNPTIPDETPH
jgi:hypothetical protein